MMNTHHRYLNIYRNHFSVKIMTTVRVVMSFEWYGESDQCAFYDEQMCKKLSHAHTRWMQHLDPKCLFHKSWCFIGEYSHYLLSIIISVHLFIYSCTHTFSHPPFHSLGMTWLFFTLKINVILGLLWWWIFHRPHPFLWPHTLFNLN